MRVSGRVKVSSCLHVCVLYIRDFGEDQVTFHDQTREPLCVLMQTHKTRESEANSPPLSGKLKLHPDVVLRESRNRKIREQTKEEGDILIYNASVRV